MKKVTRKPRKLDARDEIIITRAQAARRERLIDQLRAEVAFLKREAASGAASVARAAAADRDYRETILADALHVSILEAVDQLRPGMAIWGHNTVTARIRALLHFWPVDPNSDATKPETHYVAKLVGGGTSDDAP